MKRIAIILFALIFVAGCSTASKVMKIPPTQAKKGFDKLCADAFGPITNEPALPDNSVFDFYVGGYQGIYLETYKTRLTAQHIQDVEDFQDFCAKKPNERTAKEYGYMSGTVVRTIKELLPENLTAIPELVPLFALF